MSLHQFSFPAAITFGPGARRKVGAHLTAAGVKRPLVVTDKDLARLPFVAEFAGELQGGGLKSLVFSGVSGNPSASQVTAGTAAFREHKADGVVGIGGGAALDVAKAVALMAAHSGHVLDYAWDDPKRRPVTSALPYFVALPTTSGTGS